MANPFHYTSNYLLGGVMDAAVKASFGSNESLEELLGSKEQVIDKLSVLRNVVDTWGLTHPGEEVPSSFYDDISSIQSILDAIESIERSL
jgi:hypothetical protein